MANTTTSKTTLPRQTIYGRQELTTRTPPNAAAADRAKNALRLIVRPLARQATMKSVAIMMIAVLIAGCGYVRSGKWEDDPGNWGRALKSTQPADVVVVHLLYWRTPHWSYEAGYLFEIQPNEALRKHLVTENRLRQLQTSDIREDERPCFGECPEWFAPKPIENYEIWEYSDDPNSNFRVIIEKSTGRIFLGDYQV